nr:MAG TPA: hypothetical protein [Caudoviricetes sp.]
MTCTLGCPYPNYFLWFLSCRTVELKIHTTITFTVSSSVVVN